MKELPYLAPILMGFSLIGIARRKKSTTDRLALVLFSILTGLCLWGHSGLSSRPPDRGRPYIRSRTIRQEPRVRFRIEPSSIRYWRAPQPAPKLA